MVTSIVGFAEDCEAGCLLGGSDRHNQVMMKVGEMVQRQVGQLAVCQATKLESTMYGNQVANWVEEQESQLENLMAEYLAKMMADKKASYCYAL